MWALAGVAVRKRVLSGHVSNRPAAAPAFVHATQHQTTNARTNPPVPTASERMRAAAAAFS
eukprot:3280909-Pleurochrysis_carterae.AAC.1